MLALFAATVVRAATIYVDDDCIPPGTGSEADPFCSIQRGIDGVSGDEVIVAPGTYNETINFNGKGIELRSSEGADVTIIDATGVASTVVRCISGESPETILRGFTITGGSNAFYSGGMYIFESSPTILECVFLENSLFSGGPLPGVCGAGMLIVRGSPMLVNCQFIGNIAFHSQDIASGGGICNSGGSPVVTGCTFIANRALYGYGGGMFNSRGNPIVANCTFFLNEADYDGGGIFSADSTSTRLTVSNSILWGNSPNQIAGNLILQTGSVTFSDVQGGFPGFGNIDEDPLFVDPDGADDIVGTEDDNLRLRPGSPGIDAGDNTAVPGDTADLDGDNNTTEPTPLDLDRNPRFVDDPQTTPDTGNGTPPIVDMGAYEFQVAPIPTLSQWGLAGLTLGLLTAARLVFRRRRVDNPFPHPGAPGRSGLRALGALLGTLAWTSVASAQVDVGEQIRVDTPPEPPTCDAAANETSIASSNVNPAEIVAAWNDLRDSLSYNPAEDEVILRMGVAVSMDGGVIWEDDDLIRPPNIRRMLKVIP